MKSSASRPTEERSNRPCRCFTEPEEGQCKWGITLTTSMDQVSTSVIGASLETIDRIGPCKASIRVQRIENVVSAKRCCD